MPTIPDGEVYCIYGIKRPVIYLLNRLSSVHSYLVFVGMYPVFFELCCYNKKLKLFYRSVTFIETLCIRLQFVSFHPIINNLQPTVNSNYMRTSTTCIMKYHTKQTFSGGWKYISFWIILKFFWYSDFT